MASTSSTVRQAALTMERIDTHSHLMPALEPLTEVAKAYGRLENGADLYNSRVIAEGCRELYGVDVGMHLTPDAPAEVFAKAAALRSKGGPAAVTAALDKAGIRKQLIFTDLQAANRPMHELGGRVGHIAYLDPGISGDYCHPCPDQPFRDLRYYEALCGHFGPLASLDDYLCALDSRIDAWRAGGIVGMKTAIAYTTGLAISDPSPADAASAFARKNDMTEADFRTVHHLAFRRALLACARNALPVVIHTGYTIWGHADLTQTNPMLLHNILADERYRQCVFVLLHGGNPYIGETTYLAGVFPHVYIDFTWLTWMSRPRFRFALSEWLECVPHDRFCWGGDTGCPEAIVGVDRTTRREIASVLEEMIDRQQLDTPTALSFLQKTYLDTPKRLFGL